MKPIDELEGRELNAAFAEEVMGLPRELIAALALGPRCYSTNITAAWTVVEKLGETTPGFSLIDWPPDGEAERWVAQIGSHNYPDDLWGEALAPTAPEAICRAALAAVRA